MTDINLSKANVEDLRLQNALPLFRCVKDIQLCDDGAVLRDCAESGGFGCRISYQFELEAEYRYHINILMIFVCCWVFVLFVFFEKR